MANLGSIESHLLDISNRLVHSDSKHETVISAIRKLQSEISCIHNKVASTNKYLKRIACKQNEEICGLLNQNKIFSMRKAWKIWTSFGLDDTVDKSNRLAQLRPLDINQIPALEMDVVTPNLCDISEFDLNEAWDGIKSKGKDIGEIRHIESCAGTLDAVAENLVSISVEGKKKSQDWKSNLSEMFAAHAQRRFSLTLSPEEANKRARLQRIRSRLALLNPKRITWAYVKHHLGSREKRRILRKELVATVFGIQESKAVDGGEGSRLIHPASPFHTCIETLCVALLISTILIVPLELSFWIKDDMCAPSPTRGFNMAVDAFFLFDSLYRFAVGAVLPGGVYVDDPREVARLYLGSPGGFWFNFLTSIPFGWIDWALTVAACSPSSPDGGGHAGAGYSQHMAFARAVKPVRALKLVRLLRMSAIWGNLLIRLDLPPVFFRAFKTVCMIAICLHLCACGFYRLKLETDRDGLTDEFLGSRGIEVGDVGGAYVLCLYFMVTIFATGSTLASLASRNLYLTRSPTARSCLVSGR